MKAITLISIVVLCAGCASNGGSARGGELNAITNAYQENAGVSRERVVFPEAEAWRELAGDDIVVRTRFNDYFLLTLEAACASDLTFGSSLRLAVEQNSRNTLSRFDRVRAGNSSCRIQYIREVDHRAAAEELAARGIEEPFIRRQRDR